jgi:hypothetical protein
MPTNTAMQAMVVRMSNKFRRWALRHTLYEVLIEKFAQNAPLQTDRSGHSGIASTALYLVGGCQVATTADIHQVQATRVVMNKAAHDEDAIFAVS